VIPDIKVVTLRASILSTRELLLDLSDRLLGLLGLLGLLLRSLGSALLGVVVVSLSLSGLALQLSLGSLDRLVGFGRFGSYREKPRQ
jgi:hypothetical protein